MARQSTTAVQFGRTTRKDESVLMTSGRAGKVIPVGFAPLLRGDSASGRVGVDIELAEMPKPLLNSVVANFQAWFVPKSAHPQFSGYDEFMAAYHGESITALGQADREPPKFFNAMGAGGVGAPYRFSEISNTLGLHYPQSGTGGYVNHDLFDAFSLVYNFRLAAHSSRLQRRAYASEDLTEATSLPRAFWPTGRFSHVVPDYERALVVGALDLDVLAGQLPIEGIYRQGGDGIDTDDDARWVGQSGKVGFAKGAGADAGNRVFFDLAANGTSNIYAEMQGQGIGITLADIDKARQTQAFAQLRTAYAGNDATGFDNDDAIVAELMQGFNVPTDEFKRPWLLDSARVPFGMVERHATDAANLDQSVSRGRASASLSINVPQNDVGGMIIYTVEVLPERIYERQNDEFLAISEVDELPNALRDVQRPEPVDIVRNRRIDAAHTDPEAAYGFEPMNNVWNRSFTRLGGDYFMATPTTEWTENRAAIWQADVVDPTFSESHYLAPEDFPHDVFADTEGSAFDVIARHDVTIRGLTQIGDVLSENNDDYEAVREGLDDDA